ncbi:MAG: hypothetical protein ACP5QO_14510 [Clostridia bacterium]
MAHPARNAGSELLSRVGLAIGVNADGPCTIRNHGTTTHRWGSFAFHVVPRPHDGGGS